MSDNVRKQGFRYHGMTLGGKAPPNIVRMRVASAYQAQTGGSVSCDLNPGDPIKRVNDGTVALAAAGDSIWGVIDGIGPYYDGSVMKYGPSLPGATTYGSVLERQSFVYVMPVMGVIFEVDADDNTTATTEATYKALIGENCDHVLTTGTEPKSGCQLDISTHATSSFGWNIVDISPTLANQDFSGLYVKLLVTCNETLMSGFVTTGI